MSQSRSQIEEQEHTENNKEKEKENENQGQGQGQNQHRKRARTGLEAISSMRDLAPKRNPRGPQGLKPRVLQTFSAWLNPCPSAGRPRNDYEMSPSREKQG